MSLRFEVALKDHVQDVVGKRVANKIHEQLNIAVEKVRIVKCYTVDGIDPSLSAKIQELSILHDSVLHTINEEITQNFDWIIEVAFRPGVTDNEGRTAKEALCTALTLSKDQAKDVAVYTSTFYLINGSVKKDDIHSIAHDLLANELIQRYEYKNKEEWKKTPSFPVKTAKVTGEASKEVQTIPIFSMSNEELMAFSRANTLALTLEEMLTIKNYYLAEENQAKRAKLGLEAEPSDAEVEVLAQTWSEHCKHKIFAAKINYTDTETNETEVIDSIYKTYIQGSTAIIRKNMKENDFCLSVFKDNAGVLKFSENLNICIKVETHNSPSALDPYGGALTGIVGVNRDPMGTGLGANLLCNTNVFCFASPFYEGAIPPRLLHPRRIFEGVREGVEHGGNKSGVPTVNGSIFFDDRFLGKPLVYCGTVGTMPVLTAGRKSHEKFAEVGDYIVMCGGRIGKDGIHGATFSSEELHEGSPATAVQIGDPITQRKMYDFLMRARDTGLYNSITDNGAGGLSSSVGEMAEATGGCKMDLAKAPLKYDGLRPWEILISEAQERMTLAVPKEKLNEFLSLSEAMDVESSVLGTFTDSGLFSVYYEDVPVCVLEMEFMHGGLPQLELEAIWKKPVLENDTTPTVNNHETVLLDLLSSLNICSKEYVIRQYDHEVQGKSVVKPLIGLHHDAPADAAILRPEFDSNKGLLLSHGLCPQFSDIDTYHMMALAIDEAVRNAVATGGDINYMAGCDNFCWCDPVQSETTPDGHYKLAQLVRANKALFDYCIAFGIPCVSGKDSMKNDYKGVDTKISIPPTVLFSLIGVIPNVHNAVTSDFKKATDLIYVLGKTFDELAASEVSRLLSFKKSAVPKVDVVSARKRYETIFTSASQKLHNSAHDMSEGGLSVAIAEMAIGGRLGCSLNIDAMPTNGELDVFTHLYSESASRILVTVPKENKNAFESLFKGQDFALLGEVTEKPTLSLHAKGTQIIATEVDKLVHAFKKTLQW